MDCRWEECGQADRVALVNLVGRMKMLNPVVDSSCKLGEGDLAGAGEI